MLTSTRAHLCWRIVMMMMVIDYDHHYNHLVFKTGKQAIIVIIIILIMCLLSFCSNNQCTTFVFIHSFNLNKISVMVSTIIIIIIIDEWSFIEDVKIVYSYAIWLHFNNDDDVYCNYFFYVKPIIISINNY